MTWVTGFAPAPDGHCRGVEVPRSDAALVRAARLGDTEAFAVIVDRHGPAMHRYARFLLGNGHDAADATQEAFLSAWRGLETFRGDAALRTWLFTLVARRCADLLRKRRPTPVDTEALELHLESVRDLASGGAVESALLQALRSALLELPLLQRSCWLLREVEGLSYDEIAEALSVTPGSVRGHLHRGREALAAKMGAWR